MVIYYSTKGGLPSRRTVISKYGTVYKTKRSQVNGRTLIEGKSQSQILEEQRQLAEKKAKEQQIQREQQLEAQRKAELEKRTLEEKQQALRDAVAERTQKAQLFKQLQEEKRIARLEKDLRDKGYTKQTIVRRPSFREKETTINYLPPKDETVGVYREALPSERIPSKPKRVVSQFKEGFSLKGQDRDVRTLGGAESLGYTAGVVGKIAGSSAYAWELGGAKVAGFIGQSSRASKGVELLGRAAVSPIGRVVSKGAEVSYLGSRGFELGRSAREGGAVGVARTGFSVLGDVAFFRGADRILGKGIKRGAEAALLQRRAKSAKRADEGVVSFVKGYKREFVLGKKGAARVTPQRGFLRQRKARATSKQQVRELGTGFARSGRRAKDTQKALTYPSGQYGYQRVNFGGKVRRSYDVPSAKPPKAGKKIVYVPERASVPSGLSVEYSGQTLLQPKGSKPVSKITLKGKEASRAERELSKQLKAIKESQRQVGLERRAEITEQQEIVKGLFKDAPKAVPKPKKKVSSKLFDAEVKFQTSRVNKPVKVLVGGEQKVSQVVKPVRRALPSRPLTVAELGEKNVKSGSVYSGLGRVRYGEQEAKVVTPLVSGRVVEPRASSVDVSKSGVFQPDVSVSSKPKSLSLPDRDVRATQEIDFKASYKPKEAVSLVPATSIASASDRAVRSDSIKAFDRAFERKYQQEQKVKVTPVALTPSVPKAEGSRLRSLLKPLVKSEPVIGKKPSKTITKPRSAKPKPSKPLLPKIPKVRKSFEPERNGRGEGFRVLVRRKGKFVPEAGVFSKGSALRFGAFKVGTSSAATFKLVRAEGKVQKFSGGKFDLSNFYRKPSGEYVEKREKRIKSVGELQEITFKGLETLKKNKRRLL